MSEFKIGDKVQDNWCPDDVTKVVDVRYVQEVLTADAQGVLREWRGSHEFELVDPNEEAEK